MIKQGWLSKVPSRLPPAYIKRVVDSFMPSNEDVATLPRDELLALLQRRDEIEQLVESDPVRFFHPNPSGGQRPFMIDYNPDIQGKYFFAANKTGKTTGGAIAVGEFGEGRPIWEAESRIGPFAWLSPRPKRICIFAEDFATHEEALAPTYITWMKRYIQEVHRAPSGTLQRIVHYNGTNVYLRTYDQGYEKAEGKDYDMVWCDEPPPRDIYTAIFRGLVATRGRLLITATLLSEVWLYEEMNQPFVQIYEATMYDNQWLDSQARENFSAMLTEEERAIRIYGKPSTLSGAIFPSFHDGPPFVIPHLEPPWNPNSDRPWPVVMAVDPHERRPLYVLWGYITPNDGVLWFDWDLVPSDSIYAVFKRLREKERTHLSRTELVIMDPNRGAQRQIDGKSWMDTFEEHEYPVLLGHDDLNYGHFVMREFLCNIPRMVWTDACRGRGGPIYQTARYTWEDWGRGSRFERAPKEKPKEKYKDFPDIERYTAVAIHDGNISFSSLINDGEEESVSMFGDNLGRNSYTE
jgi:phage terminase large subunit-like protein